MGNMPGGVIGWICVIIIVLLLLVFVVKPLLAM
jgi:hypothetical protein